MAEEIRQQRVASVNDNTIVHVQYRPLGKYWVTRFIHRHPQLQTVLRQSIEAARLKGTSREALDNWFTVFQTTILEHNIQPQDVYNMDETGFSIGMIQASRVIVNSNMQSQYQAQPGRQEWISVVECITADGTSIPPFIIFKGEQLLSSWLPTAVPENWHFSCNSKGWTSNIHRLEWLRTCFEPATRYKANGRTRLLICDGHDSHISANFIAHCINNNIILLILPPHTSHLLQPLDVGVFGPLKQAISACLDRLIRTGVNRIQKPEFITVYNEARESAISSLNIFGAWRGAGLFPFNNTKVFRHLPLEISPPATPPHSLDTSFDTQLLNSSPPNAVGLHSANSALNEIINTQEPLHTPARNYIYRLTHTTERLRASVSILEKENQELRNVVTARKERKKGKWVTIEGRISLSTFEIHQALAKAERETKAAQERNKKVKRRAPSPSSDDLSSASESEQEMEDCIEVAAM